MKLTNNTNNFMNETRANFKNQSAQIHDLEVRVGQLADLLTTRPQGAFLSTTEVNPKEQCQAITLRSRREIVKSVEKEEPPMAIP